MNPVNHEVQQFNFDLTFSGMQQFSGWKQFEVETEN